MITIEKEIVNSMAEKYRLADKMVFAKLHKWQQVAILEDRASGKNSSLIQKFTQDVIETAEKMELAQPGAVPPTASSIQPPVKTPLPDWHKTNGANGNDGDPDEWGLVE